MFLQDFEMSISILVLFFALLLSCCRAGLNCPSPAMEEIWPPLRISMGEAGNKKRHTKTKSWHLQAIVEFEQSRNHCDVFCISALQDHVEYQIKPSSLRSRFLYVRE